MLTSPVFPVETTAVGPPHGSFPGTTHGLIREGTHPTMPIPVGFHEQQPSKVSQTTTLSRAKTIATLIPQSKSFAPDNLPPGLPGAMNSQERTQRTFNSGASISQSQITSSPFKQDNVAYNSETHSLPETQDEHNQDFPERFDVDDDDTDLAPTVPLSPWEDLPHATRLMRRALRKGVKVRDFGFKPDDERHYGKVDDWLWKLGYHETGLGENWKMEFQPKLPWERSDPSLDKEKESAEEGKGNSPKRSKEKPYCIPTFNLSRTPFSPQALTEKLRGVKRERSAESEEPSAKFRIPKKVPKLELRKDGEDVVMRSPRDGGVNGLESG